MNYYCLVAGLPDLHLDDQKGITSLSVLKHEFAELLSANDLALMRLIYASYDNANLLLYLNHKEAVLDERGFLTASDWEQLIALMRETEHPIDSRLYPYVHTFYLRTEEEEYDSTVVSREDFLSGLYYHYAMQCKNIFLSQWFEFNLNLNNVLTAIACRKHGFDVKSLVVGDNEIANMLRISNARDFSITGLFSYLEVVLRLADEPDLLEREKKIDALRWDWLEENSFFHYFGIEKILTFILKTQMMERWKNLTQEKGSEVFKGMLQQLKEEVTLS